jgi:hypothetical protein
MTNYKNGNVGLRKKKLNSRFCICHLEIEKHDIPNHFLVHVFKYIILIISRIRNSTIINKIKYHIKKTSPLGN